MTADIRSLLRDLLRAGWTIEHGRHYRCTPPGGGSPVFVSGTTRGSRAFQRILRDLRHAQQSPR